MSPYARGNRDGLLAFAAHCDEQAEMWRQESHKFSSKSSHAATRLHESSLWRLAVWLKAAADARRAAEAIPDDPEAVPEPKTFESRSIE